MEQDQTYKQFSSDCFSVSSSDTYLIWGDSYAAASSFGLINIHKHIAQLTASSCPPFIDINIKDVDNCRAINDFVKLKIIELKPVKIFLQSKWNNYADILEENLTKTIKIIHAISPSSKVIIIGNVPQWTPNLPTLAIRNNLALNSNEYIHMKMYELLSTLDNKLIRISQNNGVDFISPLNNLCIDQNCLASVNFKSKYWLTSWDNGHLTEAGSVYLFKVLEKEINK